MKNQCIRALVLLCSYQYINISCCPLIDGLQKRRHVTENKIPMDKYEYFMQLELAHVHTLICAMRCTAIVCIYIYELNINTNQVHSHTPIAIWHNRLQVIDSMVFYNLSICEYGSSSIGLHAETTITMERHALNYANCNK